MLQWKTWKNIRKMKRLILISLLTLTGCTQIAHISKDGYVIIDRPDLYSETARLHEEEGHLWGLYHCSDKRCYMFFMDLGRVELCGKCKAKLKTTTLDWLKNIHRKVLVKYD